MNKVAAINDISCFGRASLTTIIPILSIMKNQICPIPTTVLSTHTGGFGKPAIEDLSDFMLQTKEHWKSLNLNFQCIYSGYLGRADQVEFVKDFIKDFKKNDTIVVVDPVMADDGELYSSMDNTMVKAMKNLIKDANIITPNITEAALLLDETYKTNYSYEEIKSWLIRLSNMGPEKVIITSVPSVNGSLYIDTVAYDKEVNKFYNITTQKVNESYPGTGDIFTSVFIGGILQGKSFGKAIENACIFIKEGIEYSNKFDYPRNEGILLESMLWRLVDNNENNKSLT